MTPCPGCQNGSGTPDREGWFICPGCGRWRNAARIVTPLKREGGQVSADDMHEAVRGHAPVAVNGLDAGSASIRCVCDLNDDRPYNWHVIDLLKEAGK